MAARVDQLPSLPPRPRDGHKGTFGRILVVGGSEGMAGAPSLAGMAALKSGAGLVTVACPKAILPTVAGFHPCLMTRPIVWSHVGEVVTWCRDYDVIALGPGLGQSEEAKGARP